MAYEAAAQREMNAMAEKIGDLLAALKAAAKFIDKASGSTLGIAMSGQNHPNPDGVLTDLATEGMDLSISLHAAIAKAEERT